MWLSLFPLKLGASIGADAAAGGTGKGGECVCVCVCIGGGAFQDNSQPNQTGLLVEAWHWEKKSMGPAIHLLGAGPLECRSTCVCVCMCVRACIYA